LATRNYWYTYPQSFLFILAASGGGNWEFEYYTNNRSNSYVRNSTLFIRPTLTSDLIGGAEYLNSYDLNLWGAAPADVCTSNANYGCERIGGAGGNVLSPIQSARIRTVLSFNFQYATIQFPAKFPDTAAWKFALKCQLETGYGLQYGTSILLHCLTTFKGFSPPTTPMVDGQQAARSTYANLEEIQPATHQAVSINLDRLFTGAHSVLKTCGR
jgi:hypothetical protein